MESILQSVKKLLGIASDYTVFDADIIIHINSTFMTLRQLGIGPSQGFSIYDDTAVWNDYLSDDDINFEAVKSYMQLKVKLLFDPPISSVVLECYKQMINEFEWRLNVEAEQQSRKEVIQNGESKLSNPLWN